jgi:GTPase SAR1 family protein
MHPSYYISAHCCILCFDMTRKITYKNLDTWYNELVTHRGLGIPVIVVANKVDVDPSRAGMTFGFVERRREERLAAARAREGGMGHDDGKDEEEEEEMPLFLCSASDGTNVVKAFKEAVRRAVAFKEKGEPSGTFVDEVLKFIEEEERIPGGLFASNSNGKNQSADSSNSSLDRRDKESSKESFDSD